MRGREVAKYFALNGMLRNARFNTCSSLHGCPVGLQKETAVEQYDDRGTKRFTGPSPQVGEKIRIIERELRRGPGFALLS